MSVKKKKVAKKKSLVNLARDNSPFIVAIGASAGGLEAFRELLEDLKPNTGMAFVFIQHLSPSHESLLVPILSRTTSMKVIEVKNNQAMKPNAIHIIPPNSALELKNGIFKLLPRDKEEKPHLPIDRFFKSLAIDQKEKAISIVLSGTGSDGAEGSRLVKDQGGLTFAQSTQSARYDSMPLNAIIIDHIDFVLSPKKIAEELNGLSRVHHTSSVKISKSDVDQEYFYKILLLLKQATGTDFTLYKPTTILRRITRRMFLNKLETLKAYFSLLQVDTAEREHLGEDVLINVTTFFREPDSFEFLKKQLPLILKNKPRNLPLRVWVAACSTGEEAYSVAMSVLEVMEASSQMDTVQIFATDLSEKCIERARLGRYLDSIAEQVSEERLKKFFTKTEDGYRISKSIRDICIFAKHDLSRDPAYSRLDIISCRNVLIYLGPELQARIFDNFHYSLNPNGLLILGNSETVGKSENLFENLSAGHKFFKKKDSFSRMHIPSARRETFSPDLISVKTKKNESHTSNYDLQQEADRAILSRYSPPAVVINSKFEIVQFRGHTETFLMHKQGEASLNLLKMAREGMNTELKKGLTRAIEKNSPYRKEGLQVPSVGTFNLEILALRHSTGERHFLIIFESVSETLPKVKNTGKLSTAKNAGLELKLRQELSAVKENLHAVIQDFEIANQDLQSANEEIVSSNEELQSTNEELETSKEELQSTNEELSTVNDELQERNLELFDLNNDLINILNSVQIPIVIVGTDLNIRRYTSSANLIFNFIPADIGRPIHHISSSLVDINKITSMIKTVLETAVIQEEVITDKNTVFHLRVRPYKTQDQKIEGAVISLQEIQEAQLSVELTKVFIENVSYPMIATHSSFEIVAYNQSFSKSFKTKKDLTGENIFSILNSPKIKKSFLAFDKSSEKEMSIVEKGQKVTIVQISKNQLIPVKYLISFSEGPK